MLDVRLFRNMRFSAASGAVTVSFFTLFGFIFLMTQYFQFVRGYGALSTGVHLLPVALAVGAGSVAGPQPAVRAGTRLVVTAGLGAVAGFYRWGAATPQRTGRYHIIPAPRRGARGAGAVRRVLSRPPEPPQPASPAGPANPAAGAAETPDDAHDTETPAHPAPAAR